MYYIDSSDIICAGRVGIMSEQLKNEFTYYQSNKDEFVKQYKGKFIVIKNHEVIGVYKSEFEAITETAKTNPLGTFLVQKCEPDADSELRVYHSRVAFV